MASSRGSSESFAHVERPSVPPTPHSLSKAVHARRSEFIRPRKIRIKIGSWNVAACSGTDKDLAGWFVHGKGVDQNLAGLRVHDVGSQTYIESVGEQEDRRRKKMPTLPQGDEGVVLGDSNIDLYVLGLQEIVDLASVTEYVGKVYSDPGPMAKWRKALTEALPAGYQIVSEHQLSGLLLVICASPEIAPSIGSVSSVNVGTGVMGYLGNKGAITTRIVLGETTRLVFVNCHLASGTDPAHLDRRCWDVQQILQRTHFDPISWAGVLDEAHESIGSEDFAFWFGDLNFRLEKVPGDDIRRLLMLHTRGEYDVEDRSRKKIDKELAQKGSPIVIHPVESEDEVANNGSRSIHPLSHKDDKDSSDSLPDPDDFVQDPSQDPVSLQATLDSLLPHDQLQHVQKLKLAFHDGWREGPITFLPTYKYDVGSMGMFDSSEKKRAPSWCDRILFRSREDKREYDDREHEAEIARLKDLEMKARGIDEAVDEESVLFDYNPEDDGDGVMKDAFDEYDEGLNIDPQPALAKEGFVDRIHQEIYTSHQRVLSSDHKPLDAVFTLDYDAVIPNLKAVVQQEVAREFDRAENEGRPDVTVVVEPSFHSNESEPDSPQSPNVGGEDGIRFGNVTFQQRKCRNLTIANTSQVVSKCAFVDKPSSSSGDSDIAPAWLRIAFSSVEPNDSKQHLINHMARPEITLQPGEAINATVEIFVDDFSLVRSLNDCLKKLEDVLVIRVTNGPDHFIPVQANWLQTCFGRSIDKLIRIPQGGVRSLYPSRRKGAKDTPVNRCQEVCWSAPRELFKLTEAIDTLIDRVIADAHMIDSAQLPLENVGWPFDQEFCLLKDAQARELRKYHIIQALDSDTSLIESFSPETPAIERIEIISEILILFLASLSDGIVTEALWTQLEQDISHRGTQHLTSEETKAWVLDVLSSAPNHNISFVFLTTLLRRVTSELAPTPTSPTASTTESTHSSFDTVRKSLSWKSQQPPSAFDSGTTRRHAVAKSFAEIFSHVIFRGPLPIKEKDKRILNERRRELLEAFLQADS